MTGRKLTLRGDLLLVIEEILDKRPDPKATPEALAECKRRGWVNEDGTFTPDGVRLCAKLELRP